MAAASPSELAHQLKSILEQGRTAALVTVVEGAANVGSKMIVEQSGATFGTLGDFDQAVNEYVTQFLTSLEPMRILTGAELTPESMHPDAQILFERIESEPRVVICGAGHVGAALARLASMLGYAVTLIDDRADFLSPATFLSTVALVLADSWSDTVTKAIGNGVGVSVAVVTRGHSEDEQCLRAVMQSDPAYVGMIGSKRRTRIVLDRLRNAGIDEGKLLHVHAPIGLDIGAVTPEEVALAILAEIVMVRRGGTGTALSSLKRRP